MWTTQISIVGLNESRSMMFQEQGDVCMFVITVVVDHHNALTLLIFAPDVLTDPFLAAIII